MPHAISVRPSQAAGNIHQNKPIKGKPNAAARQVRAKGRILNRRLVTIDDAIATGIATSSMTSMRTHIIR
jgi:hypothetical protein